MNISTDQAIIWQSGIFKINQTILFTWFIMAIILVAVFVLRFIFSYEKNIGRLQNFFEILITGIEDQINKMGKVDMKIVFPFIATLFIFILFSNLLQIIPFFNSPTASLSTTMALAISVVAMGLFYGIKRVGVLGYVKKYIKPSPVMLFMNIISDVSSNCALAVRLYGNMMSSMLIGMIISKIVFLTLGFPIFLDILGFISGIIQAYIFSILALVFVMSAED